MLSTSFLYIRVKTMHKIRTYSELKEIKDFGDRLQYLSLWDDVYQSPRSISNAFYKSKIWKYIREQVIVRDGGFDLGVFGYDIEDSILVHHINPLEESDFDINSNKLTDPDNLITVSLATHNLIHYKPKINVIERKPGDTKPW